VAGSNPIQMEELKALVEELDIDYLKGEIPQAVVQSLDGLQRITKIVQSMKEFSHPGTDEKVLCHLNRAFESTIDVSRNEWKCVVELVTELNPGLPDVPVLLDEFNQVIKVPDRGWLFLGLSLWINTEELLMSKVSREKEQPSLFICPLSMTPSYHRKNKSSTGF
jgi:hypothetical protein